MSVDHSDEPGWPSPPTAVHPTPPPKLEVSVPLMLAHDRRNERARAKYKALRESGVPVREARRLRCAS